MTTQPYLLGFSFCLSLGGHTVVRVSNPRSAPLSSAQLFAQLLRNSLLHPLVLLPPMRFVACQQKQYLALETNAMLCNAMQCGASFVCEPFLPDSSLMLHPHFQKDTAAALIADFICDRAESQSSRPFIPDPRSPIPAQTQ